MSAQTYQEFLAAKVVSAPVRGIQDPPKLADHLFDYQRHCVEFGLRAGSWGLYLDTGLGKTACELEWSHHAAEASNGWALILTPLAVARQIEAEGKRWCCDVRVIREQSDARPGINVCNYDRLEQIEPSAFGSVALDEAGILKGFTGKTTRALIDAFRGHRFRLAATATPAPNDHTELAQQSEFLGLMARDEMLVRWFINDSGDTGSWRLKGHAVRPFFDWMASWSRMAEHPRDLGDDRPGFALPPLNVIRHRAEGEALALPGEMFARGSLSATDMYRVKRQTAAARAAVVGRLVMDRGGRWVVWCDTDAEADALIAELRPLGGELGEIRGSHPIEKKERTLEAFDLGEIRALITKPSITGWGLNWQHTTANGVRGPLV